MSKVILITLYTEGGNDIIDMLLEDSHRTVIFPSWPADYYVNFVFFSAAFSYIAFAKFVFRNCLRGNTLTHNNISADNANTVYVWRVSNILHIVENKLNELVYQICASQNLAESLYFK